ncbi:MAG: VWA domain-containing protein, partial [Oscillospiraceae bacterium]|nr:VWA domain-containing protein [Oscillospiraceae bacterium]
MALVMVLTFFAAPLAQTASAAPGASRPKILTDENNGGTENGAAQFEEDSSEAENRTSDENAGSQSPAEDAAPAEGTEGTVGGETTGSTATTETTRDETPVKGETSLKDKTSVKGETPLKDQTSAKGELTVEEDAPDELVTVTARWYITSLNKETGEWQDTLVFTKTLTETMGTLETINVKALDPKTEYSLLGCEVDDDRSGTMHGLYELLYDENKEIAFYFTPANRLQRAPSDPGADAELSRTVRRVSADTWEVTLKIDANTVTSSQDLDIMLLIDMSVGQNQAAREAVVKVATEMVQSLANNPNLAGNIRVGAYICSYSEEILNKEPLAPIRIGGNVQTDNVNNLLAMMTRIPAAIPDGEQKPSVEVAINFAHSQLYHAQGDYSPENPTGNNANATKYTILLTDIDQAESEAQQSQITAAAKEYKVPEAYEFNSDLTHTDGKLITVAVGGRDETGFLSGIANAGHYQYQGNEDEIAPAFSKIGNDMVSAVRNGAVSIPVGSGFTFQAAGSSELPPATDAAADVTEHLTVSQGRVMQQRQNGTPTFIWELDGPVQGAATLTYRVRLDNPGDKVNQILETNGETVLAYQNVDDDTRNMTFDAPQVMYQQGNLKLVFEGLPQPFEIDLDVRAMYPDMPAPYTFDGPESIDGRWLTSVTLRGSEGLVGDGGDIQIKTWDVTAGTMAELIAATNGRIAATNGGYSMAAPASNDIRLIFTYAPPKEVTVTYDANRPVYQGQTAQWAPGSAALPEAETHLKYENITLASGSGLKLLGYNFQGWALRPDAPAASCITRIDDIRKDTVVYAVWTLNPADPPATVTVTYHAGNATGGVPPVDSRRYLINENVAVLGNDGASPLYRVGYEFEGWSGTSGGALQYAVGSQIQGIQTGVNLYPTWVSAQRVKVLYNENLPAGSEKKGGAVPVAAEVEKYADVTLPGNVGQLVATGHDFAGWAKSPAAAAPEAAILRIAADTTVYAVWRKAPDVKIIYHKGAADTGVPPVDDVLYPKHATATAKG